MIDRTAESDRVRLVSADSWSPQPNPRNVIDSRLQLLLLLLSLLAGMPRLNASEPCGPHQTTRHEYRYCITDVLPY